ncbi:Spore germination B3/ GerAC like, C-terminal [Paenibacillus algorifonticola]|uniref:Spore germination B3/ GerAC like, C-terminal n=1 Tax=Paenibacillus algorifonticola TaxID=684063 RepID=A0A1I1Z0A8_9BACL|nr:Ger(x)C family spore germination protein [Paenibacillus algorifonticola]SFE25245.1 Spore germination B3/ GerAC like, C-terminal [Paenibacillus algorifonticola]
MFFHLSKYAVILSLMLLLSGCWSQINFDQLTVVSAIGLDVNKQGQLEVSVQLVNPTLPVAAGGGGQQRRAIAMYTANGLTVEDALETIRKQAKKSLFFSQTKVLLIGERLARQGLDDMMDFFWREPNQNFNCWVMVSKQSIPEVLSDSKELQAVAAEEWKAYFKNKTYKPTSGGIQLYQFLPRLEQSSFQAAVPGLIQVSKPSSKDMIMEIKDLAVFRNTKLVGWLTSEEAQIISWLTQQSSLGMFEVSTKDIKSVMFELKNIHIAMKPVYENGQLQMKVRMRTQATIKTSTEKLDLTEKQTTDLLETELSNAISETIEKTVYKLYRSYKSDAIGFGEAIHRKAPKSWKTLKGDWNNKLAQINVQSSISIEIIKSGLLIDSNIKKDDVQ